MRYLVVPSCREESIHNFFRAWEKTDLFENIYKMILVWDGPEVPPIEFPERVKYVAYDWRAIDNKMYSGVFSKKDSAIRSFGFYKAFIEGAEHILTMDDDCYPQERYNILDHFDILENGVSKCVSTIPNHHVRGLPYVGTGHVPISVNVGLWAGVPDLDAVHQLVQMRCQREPVPLPSATTVVSPRQYIPMCGMNLSFSREVIPLMYFPLMGEGTPYSRFDDIWAGWIVQRYCADNDLNISYGPPHVHHSRASNPWINLNKEAPGLPVNEKIWEEIDRVDCKGMTAPHYFFVMGNQLFTARKHLGLSEDYAVKLKSALTKWGELFNV